MRIVFVSQEFPPETGWGGIGTYVDVLSEALVAKGHEIHVLSTVPGQARGTTERNGVVIHRFGQARVMGIGRLTRLPESWRRVWTAAAAARLLARLPRPTIVECPEWQAEGLLIGVRRSLPLVVRMHSAARQLFPHTGQGDGLRHLDARLAARLEELSARRAAVVISTRSNLAEMLPVIGVDESATHAIPYPVRLPPPSPLADDAPPRVVFVGRLEPRKGPEVLLRAAPRVVASVPGARFVFVGRDGVVPGAPSSSAWLRAEAERLGVAHAVDLVGQRDLDGVYEELRKATVCAFPSRWESFGNVVAEAAAVGRPVVTSSLPPFEDLVSEGVSGWRVPVDDPGEWAAPLIRALSDRQEARRMGMAGADLVTRLSDPSHVADLTLAAYEHAIERTRCRRAPG
jgi:glycosyltransferase involved in cell wall biosynthesis